MIQQVCILHLLASSCISLPPRFQVQDGLDAAEATPSTPSSITNGYQIPSKACPSFTSYSQQINQPISTGPLALPFQRPPVNCRTWVSEAVEEKISLLKGKIRSPDLHRLLENTFPNTLDTAIKWFATSQGIEKAFLITGDIDAMWIRDSAAQLRPYKSFIYKEPAIGALFRGAINVQASFLVNNTFCNSLNAPKESKIPVAGGQEGDVYPPFDRKATFECKYELDSLAFFFQLSMDYFEASSDELFFQESSLWKEAVEKILDLIFRETRSTFDEKSGKVERDVFRFTHQTDRSTETNANSGLGNPVFANNSDADLLRPFLIRSGFRPSDDVTIFQYLIPSNAFMSGQLKQVATIVSLYNQTQATHMQTIALRVKQAILENAVIESKRFGKVFAYEVDGYGSCLIMDDANYPSLLGMPLMTGFMDSVVEKDLEFWEIYENTRKMLLSKYGNPYYIHGSDFEGIGSPHTDLESAWPMALMIAIQTASRDDAMQVRKWTKMLLESTSGLGLIHESVNVHNSNLFSRPWFGWANGMFGETVFDLADRFPDVLSTNFSFIT